MMLSKGPLDKGADGETVDVLLESPLVTRLVARGTEPIGAIDVRHPQHLHARASQWIAERFPLLSHLISRYGGQEPALGGEAGFIYTRAAELPGQERGGVISPMNQALSSMEKPREAISAAGFSEPVSPGSANKFRVSRRPPSSMEGTWARSPFGFQSDRDASNAVSPEHPAKPASPVAQDTEMKTPPHAPDADQSGNRQLRGPGMQSASDTLKVAPSVEAPGFPSMPMPPVLGKANSAGPNRVSELRGLQPPVEAHAAHLSNLLNEIEAVSAGSSEQKERADSRLFRSASDSGRHDFSVSMPVRTVSSPGGQELDRGRAQQEAPHPVRTGTIGRNERAELDTSSPASPGDPKAQMPLRAASPTGRATEYRKPSVGRRNLDTVVEERGGFSEREIPNMVWRKDSVPAQDARSQFSGPGQHQAWAPTQHTLSNTEPASSPVAQSQASPPSSAARSGGDIDIAVIAEKVSRVIARKLIIERERRGVSWWR